MIKYTKEQESELYDAYHIAEDIEARKEVVAKYAKRWTKPEKSIIAKLSRMGIYVSISRMSKISGAKPETKEQIVTKLESKFFVKEGAFAGLEKAPKLVLIKLLAEG